MTDLEQQKKDEINEYEIRLWKELFSATNKDLGEKSLDLLQTKNDLADMTEARDAVSAASKFLRDRCDIQDAVLKIIAKHGTANPAWAVRIAKAAVDKNFGEPTINDEVEQRR